MADDGYIFDGPSAARIVRQTVLAEKKSRYSESADYGDPGRDGGLITVKVTGAASGGGKYTGRSVLGDSTAVATGDLAMPEGMTVAAADDCLILFLPEDGLPTHRLKVNSFAVGVIVGALSDGTLKVEVSDGVGATASPATLGSSGEGSEGASSDTWTRNATASGTDYGGTALDLWITSRVGYFESGDQKLYGYTRKISIDAAGRVYAVSAETRYEIDVPGNC